MSRRMKPTVFYASLTISYAVLLIIASLDLSADGNPYLVVFVSTVSRIFPMIGNLSAKYPNPQTARLMFSVAWLLAIALGVILFRLDDESWRARTKLRWSGLSKDKRLTRGLLLFLTLLFFLYYATAFPTDGHSHAVRLMLSNAFFLALLGGTCVFAVPIFIKSFSLALVEINRTGQIS